MKLLEFMLDVARMMGIVVEGTATGGSTTTLIDTNLDLPAESFVSGTLWILSGDNEGACLIVSSYGSNTITFTPALSTTIAAGDKYAVASAAYPKYKLKQSILLTLLQFPTLLMDNSLTVEANQTEYDLPDSVSNIKRIEIATQSDEPYGYVPNFGWYETNGKINFSRQPGIASHKMRIWYEGYHGAIDDNEDIKECVDLELLKWSAIVNLYRDLLIRIKKDSPMDVDLLNEAKTMEAEARRNMKKRQLQSMTRDPILTM